MIYKKNGCYFGALSRRGQVGNAKAQKSEFQMICLPLN